MQSLKSNALEPTRSELAALSRGRAIVRVLPIYGLPILTVLLIISNAVQNAMVGSDTSLNAGILAAATLLIADRLLDRVALWRRDLIGTPALLVQNGHILEPALRRESVAVDDVLQALREHGVADLSKVKLAVLEVDGTISVVPDDAPSTRTRRRVRGRKLAAG